MNHMILKSVIVISVNESDNFSKYTQCGIYLLNIAPIIFEYFNISDIFTEITITA